MKRVKKISLFFIKVLVLSFIFSLEAKADIFDTLSDKTITFAVGLRNLAYVISSFGIIMFTFLAICGKINFKHLSYIAISLFFMSGVGSLIDYVTDDDMSLTTEFRDTYQGAVCESSICRG